MKKLSEVEIINSLQHRNNPQIFFSPDNISEEVLLRIPKLWLPCLSISDIDFSALQLIWQPVYDRLPYTMEAFEEKLAGIVLFVEDATRLSLLYIFRYASGKLSFYQGFPPISGNLVPQAMKPIWSKLPKDILSLYSVHNGWILLQAKAGGYLPIEKWSMLSWDEWSLEEKIKQQLPVPPEQIALIYADGGGGYLGFELLQMEVTIPAKALAWRTQESGTLKRNVDFWTEFDTRTFMHLEDYESAF